MLTYADVYRAAEVTATYEEMRMLLDVPWSLLEDLQAKGLAAGALTLLALLVQKPYLLY